ncbi:MAG: AAA family ATPase, partial [Acidimicrobiia bacterium]|nr:AAA family ATPase [Acidimicrobiia bacterium]
MARSRTRFTCGECGAVAPKWSGRCADCGQWNTLVEEVVDTARAEAVDAGVAAVPITSVDPAGHVPVPTGLDEADRVLDGGLVPGSITLLAGPPGVGKSTLVLQAVASLAGRELRSLYLTAEESASQVRGRAERLGALHDGVWLVADTSLSTIERLITEIEPDLVVVDSIQTVHDPE